MQTQDQWLTDAHQKYSRKLLNYADTILHDFDASKDVVSETFIRLHKKGEIVGEYLAQWLHRVCRNVAISYIRRQSKYCYTGDNEKFDEEPSEDIPLSVEIEHSQEINRMMHCLNLITKKQQYMVRLRFFEGRSYQEISKITNQKLGNVAFTLHAAMKKLRDKMEGY